MMELSLVISFLAVSILLTLAPGPDILFVIAQSMSNGRKAGIMTALGLANGVRKYVNYGKALLYAAIGIRLALAEK
ncbi:LysE family transporter [Brevibacillus sp. AY1]|nr:LysE family transporter [Brevibacillus sp. AY1]